MPEDYLEPLKIPNFCFDFVKRTEEVKTKKFPDHCTVWGRVGTDYVIISMSDEHREDVLDLIAREYIETDVLCTEMKNENKSMQSFLKRVERALDDGNSLVVLKESTGNFVGVLVLQVVKKIDFGRIYSRTALPELKTCAEMQSDGVSHNKRIDIHTALHKDRDLFLKYNTNIMLRFCLVCIEAKSRTSQLEYNLIRAGVNLGGYLNIPIIAGVFSDATSQRIAIRIGFEIVQEIQYENWCDSEHHLIFNNTGLINDSCALMVAEMPTMFVEQQLEEVRISEDVQKGKKKKSKKNKGSKSSKGSKNKNSKRK